MYIAFCVLVTIAIDAHLPSYGDYTHALQPDTLSHHRRPCVRFSTYFRRFVYLFVSTRIYIYIIYIHLRRSNYFHEPQGGEGGGGEVMATMTVSVEKTTGNDVPPKQ